jgi:hypothetical protein
MYSKTYLNNTTDRFNILLGKTVDLKGVDTILINQKQLDLVDGLEKDF